VVKDQIVRIFFILFFSVKLWFIFFIYFCSNESYGGEALFGPDVDFFGESYRTGGTPKKHEEEFLGSFRQAIL